MKDKQATLHDFDKVKRPELSLWHGRWCRHSHFFSFFTFPSQPNTELLLPPSQLLPLPTSFLYSLISAYVCPLLPNSVLHSTTICMPLSAAVFSMDRIRVSHRARSALSHRIIHFSTQIQLLISVVSALQA
mgnify:CR=1 FL=1